MNRRFRSHRVGRLVRLVVRSCVRPSVSSCVRPSRRIRVRASPRESAAIQSDDDGDDDGAATMRWIVEWCDRTAGARAKDEEEDEVSSTVRWTVERCEDDDAGDARRRGRADDVEPTRGVAFGKDGVRVR